MTEVHTLKSAGCKVFVGTVTDLSASGTGAGGGTPEAWKDQYDTRFFLRP